MLTYQCSDKIYMKLITLINSSYLQHCIRHISVKIRGNVANWPVLTQYSSYARLIFNVSSDDDDNDVAVAGDNMVDIGTSDDDDDVQ